MPTDTEAAVALTVLVTVEEEAPTPAKFTAADSDPEVGTIPIVCIRRRVTSSGYANVCANNPDNAPHCNRSMVVGSLWVMCVI